MRNETRISLLVQRQVIQTEIDTINNTLRSIEGRLSTGDEGLQDKPDGVIFSNALNGIGNNPFAISSLTSSYYWNLLPQQSESKQSIQRLSQLEIHLSYIQIRLLLC